MMSANRMYVIVKYEPIAAEMLQDTVRTLAAQLVSDVAGERLNAQRELVRFNRDKRVAIAELLKSGDPNIRKAAGEVLEAMAGRGPDRRSE